MLCIFCGIADHNGLCPDCENTILQMWGDEVYFAVVIIGGNGDYTYRLSDEDEVPHVLNYPTLSSFITAVNEPEMIEFYSGLRLIVYLPKIITARQRTELGLIQRMIGPIMFVTAHKQDRSIRVGQTCKQGLLDFFDKLEATTELFCYELPSEIPAEDSDSETIDEAEGADD